MSRNESITEICQKKNSFLIEDEAGNITLNNTRKYFYKVQTRLLVTNVDHVTSLFGLAKIIFIKAFIMTKFSKKQLLKNHFFFLFFTFCKNCSQDGTQTIIHYNSFS